MYLKHCDNSSLDFQALVTIIDAELAIRDGDEHTFYHQFNGIEGLDHVIVAYNKGQPVGCGAFKVRNKQQGIMEGKGTPALKSDAFARIHPWKDKIKA